jgi:transcription elongation factor Elf1
MTEKQSTAPELLPCPFCGAEKAYCEIGGLYAWCKCGQCGAESSAQTSPVKAIAAWNARVHPVAQEGPDA